MKISTNWLRDFVTLTPPLERIADRLTMAGLEVKHIEPRPDCQDTVFEVEITTNRPDWLSHLGVAREIHAVENTGLKLPPSQNPEHRAMPAGWRLQLKEAEACPYYTACLLEGVEQRETPDWMRHRLLVCGLRPINLIVDITNYVLLEFGQPLHAFDADLLKGKEVVIRRAKAQELFAAIDGKNYSLQPDDLVIADRDRAVAVAGVMGGRETEVSDRTRNILLESAFFHPRWVRKTSLRLGLASESSYRFERRVDPEGVDLGRERAIHLFQELTGARNVSAVLKAGRKPSLEKSRLHLALEQVKKILGTEIKPHQIHSVLTRLGLEPRNENAENWVVTIPSYRADLERPVDLVEEVARIMGYDAIPESLPERAPIEISRNPLREMEGQARNFFAGAGFFETVTFSLVNPVLMTGLGFPSKDWVTIHNPIHQELTLMRPSLILSLIEVLARNMRNGERSAAFFEIANTYLRPGKGEAPNERRTLGLLAAGEKPAGWGDAKRPLNFFDLKGALESFLDFLGAGRVAFDSADYPFFQQSAQLSVDKEVIGFLGQVSSFVRTNWDVRPEVFFAELDLEKLVRKMPEKKIFSEVPRYPAVERDLALVVDGSIRTGEVVREIERMGQALIRKVELFDLFQGGRIPKGKKNLAFRIRYQSLERTLLSEEVQKLHTEIGESLAKKFQASFQETKPA